jgi:hypothetical protein
VCSGAPAHITCRGRKHATRPARHKPNCSSVNRPGPKRSYALSGTPQLPWHRCVTPAARGRSKPHRRDRESNGHVRFIAILMMKNYNATVWTKAEIKRQVARLECRVAGRPAVAPMRRPRGADSSPGSAATALFEPLPVKSERPTFLAGCQCSTSPSM